MQRQSKSQLDGSTVREFSGRPQPASHSVFKDEATRRKFLRAITTSVGSAAMLGGVASISQAAKPKSSKFPITLPFQANPTWLQDNFVEIANDEIAHVEILQALLIDEDNAIPPRQLPTLRHLEQPNFLAFVRGAVAFENTGSGTYGGALIAIQQTQEYFPAAVGITTVEARHAGFLNALLNEPLVPDFFPSEGAIPQSTALTHVDPFIAKLNGFTPSFDPNTASDPNNFAILDFLLLLEMVEAAYYTVNVMKFFPDAQLG